MIGQDDDAAHGRRQDQRHHARRAQRRPCRLRGRLHRRKAGLDPLADHQRIPRRSEPDGGAADRAERRSVAATPLAAVVAREIGPVDPDWLAVDVVNPSDHRRQLATGFPVPAPRLPAQRRRRGYDDAAAGEIIRHRASARILGGIPEASCQCAAPRGIVASGSADGHRRCASAITAPGIQPHAPQLGEYVARLAAGPAANKQPAVAPIGDG